MAGWVYRVEITFPTTGWSLVVRSDEPAPDPAAGVWALDRFTLSWDTPEDTWPAEPDPLTVSFTLGSTHAHNLPPLDIGTPLLVLVHLINPAQPRYQDPGTGELREFMHPVVEFAGRVTDADAELPHGSGVVVDVIAADHVATLAETYIGDTPWPIQSAQQRLAAIADAAGITLNLGQVTSSPYYSFRALDIDNRPALEVLRDHLAQVNNGGSWTGWGRFYLHAYDPGRNGQPTYVVGKLDQRKDGTHVAELADLGGQWSMLLTEGVGRALLLPAALVEYRPRFHRAKATATNRVDVTTGDTEVVFQGEPPVGIPDAYRITAEDPDQIAVVGPITRKMESTLHHVIGARAMAAMYLGEAVTAQSWVLEAFTYLPTEAGDPEDWSRWPRQNSGIPTGETAFQFFPLQVTGTGRSPMGNLVVLADIPVSQQLGPRPWVAGQLVGASLAIEAGELRVTGRIRPGVPPSGSVTSEAGGALRYVDAPGTYATWDRTLSYYDLRLARS